MLIIRPVRQTDLGGLLDLAALTGFGLTTLPRDRELLAQRIEESEHSFRRMAQRPRGETYLFVMEDAARNHRVIGTCGVTSKVGGFEPFYAYRLQASTIASEMLNVCKQIQTLTLVEEHSGPCEIGSLFLHPDYRRDGNGRLLSLARFLFMAEHRPRFEPQVIAEMRGVIDENGRSDFWDAVGKHFFEIDFPKADYLSMVNKKFIADLMPRHPLYVALLPAAAQGVIGQVHPDTRPALKLLESEGFQRTEMVDIFEAGPVVSVQRDEIRTIRDSSRRVVERIAQEALAGPMMHLLNPRLDCRMVRGGAEVLAAGSVCLERATAEALEVKVGEVVRIAATHGQARERTAVMAGSGMCFIRGAWCRGGGGAFLRDDPAEGRRTWEGNAAGAGDIERAVAAANGAGAAWAEWPVERRRVGLESFGRALAVRRDDLLKAISLETGRPRWEVRTECDALLAKIDLTCRALQERRAPVSQTKDGITSATRYKPLGTVAVLGPFNLPAHLPNGHIVPALLAGNTVVFKPSELTPLVGEWYTRCVEEGGLPAGVFNMIQGGREQGAALASHPGVDGVLFTGSRAAGVALCTALAPHPEKLLALEMGGNNPLVAMAVGNLDAAAYTIIQSAFLTAGQRCTCARRLILLQDAEGDRLLARTVQMARNLRVGPPSLEPEPFMGPVISDGAAARLHAAQAGLLSRGANALLPLRTVGSRPAMLAPALLDVTGVAERSDEELFGPLLQVIRVRDFEVALVEANRTRFGLAAALLSDDAGLYERFQRAIRAGIINWNRPTNGASSALPFGGIGASGNHRPAGAFAIDYCNDPVASLEAPGLSLPAVLSPGISL